MFKEFLLFMWGFIKFSFFFMLFTIVGLVLIILSNGKIYIEGLVVFIIIVMILSIFIYKHSSRKRLTRTYNPENDKTRKGETSGDFIRRTPEEPNAAAAPGQRAVEGRGMLQAESFDDAGKANPGRRKVRIFRARRRK